MNFIKLFIIQCLSLITVFTSVAAIPSLKVGVTAGPHLEILEFVRELAKKQNLEIQIIEFNDFMVPNLALEGGEIDVNVYQHLPFLKEEIKSKGFQFETIGKTILLPMGVYSRKIKNLDELKNNAIVAIPTDPTNSSRSLLLLAKLGLVTLDPKATFPTLLNITSNPKNLKFREMEPPMIPRSLPDVDIGITNTDWIISAGMSPDQALATEGPNSPYVNLIVVRKEDVNNPHIQQFVKIYQSQAIKDFIKTKFKNAIIPAWD